MINLSLTCLTGHVLDNPSLIVRQLSLEDVYSYAA